MSSTQIKINGQSFDASALKLPDRKWRDAFDTPVDGVVGVNAAKKREILTGLVKDECKKRIYAVADETTQMNLAAAAATDLLSSEDLSTFKASLAWVAAMRANVATLVAADDEDYAADAKWPAVPAGAVELGKKY